MKTSIIESGHYDAQIRWEDGGYLVHDHLGKLRYRGRNKRDAFATADIIDREAVEGQERFAAMREP